MARMTRPRELAAAGIVLALSMALCALIGIAIEYLAYRPLRDRPKLNVLITAIGVSLFLEYTGQLVFGATQQLSGDAQSAVSTFMQASQQRDEQRRQQELEQLAKARDGLLQMYPDDTRRPAAVVSRLAQLDTRMRILAGETTLTTSVTSAIATAASTTSAGGNVDVVGAGVGALGGGGGGAPFDGRREP